jgi:hypothetical protein
LNQQAYSPAFTVAAQAPTPIRTPLTQEVLSATNEAIDVARQIRTRLVQTRDRLFGPQPESNAAKTADRASQCFADEHEVRAETLLAILADIDRLSGDLANRL